MKIGGLSLLMIVAGTAFAASDSSTGELDIEAQMAMSPTEQLRYFQQHNPGVDADIMAIMEQGTDMYQQLGRGSDVSEGADASEGPDAEGKKKQKAAPGGMIKRSERLKQFLFQQGEEAQQGYIINVDAF